MMNNGLVKLLIGEDHNLFREGLKLMFSNDKEIFIVSEAKDGKELITKYFEFKPDLILTDISMPQLDGIEALKEIKKKDPDVKALFLSMYHNEYDIYNCINAGGLGLIGKDSEKGELRLAIKKAASGYKYFRNNSVEEKVKKITTELYPKNDFHTRLKNKLTPVEEKVLLLIAGGYKTIEIAETLNIGNRTVDFHRRQIIQKFNLKSLPGLIRFAIKYEIMYQDNQLKKIS